MSAWASDMGKPFKPIQSLLKVFPRFKLYDAVTPIGQNALPGRLVTVPLVAPDIAYRMYLILLHFLQVTGWQGPIH